MTLPARFRISSSATISRSQMMPSVRAWFDEQLAKDESIAPCSTHGHPSACVPCTRQWDGGDRFNNYRTTAHVHNAWRSA